MRDTKIGPLRMTKVAGYLGISEKQLRRLERQGRIPNAKRDRGGRYYTLEDLAELAMILHPNTDYVPGDYGHWDCPGPDGVRDDS